MSFLIFDFCHYKGGPYEVRKWIGKMKNLPVQVSTYSLILGVPRIIGVGGYWFYLVLCMILHTTTYVIAYTIYTKTTLFSTIVQVLKQLLWRSL